jgi:uncharacterized protein
MIIDVNVSTGVWPFRKFSIRTITDLESHLKRERVDAALVSSLEPVFYSDPEPADDALLEQTKHSGMLYGVPVINLSLPTWPGMVEKYLALPETAGIKLHPSYHGYKITGPQIRVLASRLEDCGAPLVISMRMEDERLHYFRITVPPEPVEGIRELALEFPNLNIIVLNCYLAEIRKLKDPPPNLFTDIAFAETLYTLENVLSCFPDTQILFGSHTPFFVTLAAKVKAECSEADQTTKARVLGGNAAELFSLPG